MHSDQAASRGPRAASRGPSLRACVGALSALGLLFSVGHARAQQQGFALNRYEPAERGSEWFAQDTLDLRGHLRPAVGVTGDFGYKPLVIYNADGSERTAVVERQLFAHVGATSCCSTWCASGSTSPWR